MMRVGLGYDIHPLVTGRPLILGGVSIPYSKGLKGHSDADVLVHAICNALLGALGQGDLGSRFPSTDPRYRDYPSTRFLEEISGLLREEGFHVINIDSNVIAQAPRLSPFMAQMRSNFAKILEVEPDQIGIKATTPEGVGAFGKGEGIAAQAVCLIEKRISSE